jgi:hypothetical protein
MLESGFTRSAGVPDVVDDVAGERGKVSSQRGRCPVAGESAAEQAPVHPGEVGRQAQVTVCDGVTVPRRHAFDQPVQAGPPKQALPASCPIEITGSSGRRQ